ncbi:MAG: hypothetical protein KBT46_04580, partial [Ruminococcus sp.]|nr:hypothetical protein [Candidatus Copronaster equi]
MQEIDMSRNAAYEDNGPSLDMGRLVKNLIGKLWIILLVGAVFAASSFAIAKATYSEVYSSEMTLGFMTTEYVVVKDYSNSKDTPVQYKEETRFFSNSDTPRYQALIKGDEMLNRIQTGLANDDVGKEYDRSFIADSLAIAPTAEDIAGFFVISVTSSDKGYCERALKIVLQEFPQYVQSYDNTVTIKVIKNPSAPYVSNADEAGVKAAYGFFIGAAIVIAIIFIITMATNTVLTLESLRRDINVNVLGSVPLLEKATGLFKQKKKTPSGSLLITDSSKVSFTFVESFKAIRTKIENIKSEKGYKVFVITSTYEDEGKTTTAVNIA